MVSTLPFDGSFITQKNQKPWQTANLAVLSKSCWSWEIENCARNGSAKPPSNKSTMMAFMNSRFLGEVTATVNAMLAQVTWREESVQTYMETRKGNFRCWTWGSADSMFVIECGGGLLYVPTMCWWCNNNVDQTNSLDCKWFQRNLGAEFVKVDSTKTRRIEGRGWTEIWKRRLICNEVLALQTPTVAPYQTLRPNLSRTRLPSSRLVLLGAFL